MKCNCEPTATHPEVATGRPAVDVRETEAAVVLQVDMPGVDESSIEISIEDGVLRVEGQNLFRDPAIFAVPGLLRSWLSRHIAREGIRATARNGVLEVRLPKAADEVHRIEVTAR